ncbi:MAG TPA: LON peptidase substrate-binding domain-containing protein [Fimbriimonadaceae bacterium]|nr:LON peptidase substrate-binding domain-containing protein [Fimbriimonadaceae bacterium]HRJ97465.1 LON peptidase substrate-binding domain-containing protein [Fimbriimonadaceae bacterium]
MAQHLEELPLFPLHTVLFPYASLLLHVFEDRYRQMVNQCIEFDQPFGVVLIRNGPEVGGIAEPYMVGTAVRVQRVNTYDDGHMDVNVRGERRFRVRSLDDSKQYLVGQVEPVVECAVEEDPRTEALVMDVRESFRVLIEGMFGRPDYNIQILYPSDPTALSFVVANYLTLGNIEKQRLLETTDTVERLVELKPLIERQIIEAKPRRYYKLTRQHLEDWIYPN